MTVPLLDLSGQHTELLPKFRAAFEQCATSGRFILGPNVEVFERELASYCGSAHAVGASSGTDALLMAMMAMDIGPGDEVLTTPFTFFATAGCIARLGAKPVFVDIDSTTMNIDPAQVASAVTGKTKAIVPVHLFGQAADIDQIMQVAQRHGLKVIEDAAQAAGATYNGRKVAAIGDVGCLSFFPTKSLGAMGDAGACVTDDAKLQQRMYDLRVHGSGGGDSYPLMGGNFRIDALQAAILSIKLPLLDGWIAQRRQQANGYNRMLEGMPLALPLEQADCFHTYNYYTVRVLDERRNALCRHLSSKGIGHKIYYSQPLHLQPCFADLGYKSGQLPVAEQAANEVLSLPIFPGLTESQQDAVVRGVKDFYSDG